MLVVTCQIIVYIITTVTPGYLGQTGLANGPHLHYEVLINGHFVDPMKVKLARTRAFDGRMLGSFTRERDRIEELP